ncbi:hypothetical protein [Legionella donaldsonii]|uniref:hypothetical protein n=1 Tax=Legionella donaldsonii TaxID=45060 RepID=UPI00399C9178
MNPIYNVAGFLQQDKRAILNQIAFNIVNELVILEGDVDGQNLLIAAEIAQAIDALLKEKSFTSRTKVCYQPQEIEKFFNLHMQAIQDLAGQLYALNESDLYKDICTLGELLYAGRWDTTSHLNNEKALLATENTRVLLYCAENGELAIRFPNEQVCRAFSQHLKPAIIPENFRKGAQYERNPKGFTPVRYEENLNCLFIPSYKALNGEFAINCGTQENRDGLLKLLGLKISSTQQTNTYTTTIYADGLFTIYSVAKQSNAIYFNKENKIFTEKGTCLKIDTTTGEIRQIQIKDFSKIVQKRPPSRFDAFYALDISTLHQPVPAVQPVEAPQAVAVKSVLSKNCLFMLDKNNGNEPEITIQFPDQFSRDQWHATFVGFAKSIGISITNDSLVEKSDKDSSILRFKAWNGEGSIGVFSLNPSSSTLFQSQTQISIDFGDLQLRELFIETLGISDQVATIFTDCHRARTLHFKPGILNSQADHQLNTKYNDEALASYTLLLSAIETSTVNPVINC